MKGTAAQAHAHWDTVAEILAGKKTGAAVRLRGWVHRQRTGGKLAFVVLRDGTGTLQCTVKAGVADDDSLARALRAKLEASVELLEGSVVADARAPGGFEVKATNFVLHEPHGPTGDFPMQGGQGAEFELDNRHLWLRSTEISAVLRIKHRLYKAIHDFFDAEGFTQADPSVITTNACEGGSTLFTFDYFGQTAYLSQSSQMYLEGLIFGLPKVYSITPSFRAEKSRTNKHLTEFHHLEAEYAWWDAEDNRVFQERMVTHLAHDIAKHCENDLRLLKQDPAKLLTIGTFEPGRSPSDKPGHRFPRIDYKDAITELHRQGFKLPYGEDFGVPHEKALTEGRTNPIFICDWPAQIKAFYMDEKKDTDRVLCSDMLAPEGFGEIIGGSQRSEDVASMERRLLEQTVHELLEVVQGQLAEAERATGATDEETQRKLVLEFIKAAVEHRFGSQPAIWETAEGRAPKSLTIEQDSPIEGFGTLVSDGEEDVEDKVRDVVEQLRHVILSPYQWYFDLRRYGSVPHAGFGLGIERLLRWFTGQEHIRDMLPYPRTPARAYP